MATSEIIVLWPAVRDLQRRTGLGQAVVSFGPARPTEPNRVRTSVVADERLQSGRILTNRSRARGPKEVNPHGAFDRSSRCNGEIFFRCAGYPLLSSAIARRS